MEVTVMVLSEVRWQIVGHAGKRGKPLVQRLLSRVVGERLDNHFGAVRPLNVRRQEHNAFCNFAFAGHIISRLLT